MEVQLKVHIEPPEQGGTVHWIGPPPPVAVVEGQVATGEWSPGLNGWWSLLVKVPPAPPKGG